MIRSCFPLSAIPRNLLLSTFALLMLCPFALDLLLLLCNCCELLYTIMFCAMTNASMCIYAVYDHELLTKCFTTFCPLYGARSGCRLRISVIATHHHHTLITGAEHNLNTPFTQFPVIFIISESVSIRTCKLSSLD